jgi:hypothetical protein
MALGTMAVDVRMCKDRLIIIAQFPYQRLGREVAETTEKKLIIQMGSLRFKELFYQNF